MRTSIRAARDLASRLDFPDLLRVALINVGQARMQLHDYSAAQVELDRAAALPGGDLDPRIPASMGVCQLEIRALAAAGEQQESLSPLQESPLPAQRPLLVAAS